MTLATDWLKKQRAKTDWLTMGAISKGTYFDALLNYVVIHYEPVKLQR